MRRRTVRISNLATLRQRTTLNLQKSDFTRERCVELGTFRVEVAIGEQCEIRTSPKNSQSYTRRAQDLFSRVCFRFHATHLV